MDIFDCEYYRLFKKIYILLGCWPYQKQIEKTIIRLFQSIVIMSGLIAASLHVFLVRHDMHLMINCLPIFLTYLMHIIKYCSLVFNEDKIRDNTNWSPVASSHILNVNQQATLSFLNSSEEQMRILLDMMKDNWKMYHTEREQLLMHKYAKTGRSLSLMIFVSYYTGMTLYLLLPFTPILLDILKPLNESRSLVFIFETDYLVDREKNFVSITVHHYILAICAISVIVAMDGTYGIYTQHACGMFAITKGQFEKSGLKKTSAYTLSSNEMINGHQISYAIEKHKKAIRFSIAMTSVYEYLLFFIMALGLATLSVSGVQILLNLDKPHEVARFGLLCFTHLFHIFYYSWNGQNIIDYSNMIHDVAYNAEWYTVLDKEMKHLILVMLRSSKPCEQTVGYLFPMNLVNFTAIMKTAASYFTVLSNFQ